MRSTLKYNFCRILIIVFITITSLPLSAQDRYVDQGGSDVGNDCSIPGMPCATIQHAVDNAIDGDTIFINSGTYTESIYINKDLNLIGESTQSTIIQAHTSRDSGAHRVLTLDKYITDSLAVSIAEMKIQNGNASGKFPDNRGGGIFNKGDLTLTNVILEQNYAEKYGGGLCDIGSTTIDNVEFIKNVAGESGGGMFGDYWNKTIRNSEFVDNKAVRNGGGLFLHNIDSLFLESNIYTGNYALDGGGANITNSHVISYNETYENNWAEFYGGGASYIASTVQSTGVVFHSNVSYFDDGGGVNFGTSNAIISSFNISNNRTQYGEGAGLFYRGYGRNDELILNNGLIHNNYSANRGGGIGTWSPSRIELNNIDLKNNYADFSGAGIYGSGVDTLDLNNSIIYNNTAIHQGAGMYIEGGKELSIVNTLIAKNECNEGAGIYLSNFDSININSSTFVENNADENGGAIFTFSSSTSIAIKNSNFWNNEANEMGNNIYDRDELSEIEILYSNIKTTGDNIITGNLTLGDGVLFKNPDFKAGIDNYQLSNESPLINQGDPDTDLDNYPVNNDEEKIDLAGNPRIVDEIIDIGAYENQEAGKITSQKLTSVDKNMKVFPNPAIDHINVIIPASFQSTQSFLYIYNSTGRKIISKELSTTPRELRINTGNFHVGNYIISLTDKHGKITNLKFVKL